MRLDEFTESMTCSECGGPAFSDLLLAEKKDACYNKVRSRYKVWPSAYASGALVQCRKKGAANWGNKSEGVEEDAVDEGLGSKLAGLGLAGAMALGSAGANARVTPDGQGGYTGGFKPAATATAPAAAPTATAPASQTFSKEYLQRAADPNRTGRYMISVEKAQELLSNMQEGSDKGQKIGNMDADDFDAAMARLKKLAGAGPMKTVYDPARRQYRNMPTAQQPPKQPKK